jgi:large subunit ribosomal protein L24e
MVEKRTCDYTGDDIEPGTGTMFVKTDGTVLHFKDSKAEKNYLLGRESRDLEWTTTGRQQAERAQASRDAAQTAADEEAAAASEETDEAEPEEAAEAESAGADDEADEADEADAEAGEAADSDADDEEDDEE